MTNRVTFGVDPGMAGAIATLLDGEPGPLLDMPLMPAVDGKSREVDARRLAEFIGGVMGDHPGAYFSVCIERVRAMPNRQGGQVRTMGAQSMFNFGDGFGQVKAVFRVKRVPLVLVEAQTWKRRFGLIGCTKQAGLDLARLRFPTCAAELKRVKDNGRGDALLLALWHDATEMRGSAAA